MDSFCLPIIQLNKIGGVFVSSLAILVVRNEWFGAKRMFP
jgi:hypothetical protein